VLLGAPHFGETNPLPDPITALSVITPISEQLEGVTGDRAAATVKVARASGGVNRREGHRKAFLVRAVGTFHGPVETREGNKDERCDDDDGLRPLLLAGFPPISQGLCRGSLSKRTRSARAAVARAASSVARGAPSRRASSRYAES